MKNLINNAGNANNADDREDAGIETANFNALLYLQAP